MGIKGFKQKCTWTGKDSLEKIVKLIQEFYNKNNRSPYQAEIRAISSKASCSFVFNKEWREEDVIDMSTLFKYANIPITDYRKSFNRERSIQKAKKHVGGKYGSLLIKEIIGFKIINRLQVYADCDCGNKNKIYQLTHILNGNTGSCGKCHLFSEEERLRRVKKRIYGQYKVEAKKRWRNYEFLISQDELIDLLTKPCRSCGEKPSIFKKYNGSKYYKGNDGLWVNTVDRIDSTKGYIKGNIMTLCYDCNIMKNSFDLETVAKKATALGKLATKLLDN